MKQPSGKQPARHWASLDEKGSLWGMRLLLWLYRLGGRPLFAVCLFPVVLFYSLFHPLARRSSLQYRQQMHLFNPDFPAPRSWHYVRHFWSFAITLLDKLAVWMGKIQRRDAVLYNGGLIDELLDRGQGAVILLSHLGNFEVCQALSESRPGMRLTVLHHTHHAKNFNTLLQQSNHGSSIAFMQVSEIDPYQAMRLSERLARGGFVAISADRVSVTRPERSLMLPFLGRPAPFPTGPFIFAQSIRAPVISIECLRDEDTDRYHIYFTMLSEGGTVPRNQRWQTIQTLMNSYVENLQRYCLNAPWQWYNFFPFWPETNDDD